MILFLGGTFKNVLLRDKNNFMGRVVKNYLDLIGNTPLVKLNKLTDTNDATVYLKLEYFNIGGSTKDRIALAMIEDFEKKGVLKAGMTIVESSSGNTGVGLAIASAIKGYKFVAVCDRYLPAAKRYKLKAYGAQIIFIWETPEGFDTVELRIDIAKRIASHLPNAVTLNQYDNLANCETHYQTTGQEIWNDLKGNIDVCVVPVGTCGSISGIGRALKEKNSDIEIIGVEPIGSMIFGSIPENYLIQGGGLSFIPKNLDRTFIDRGVQISDQVAFETARLLAMREGIMVGGTGGLSAAVCIDLAKKLGKGKTIVGTIPDSGDRYLDTFISDEWLLNHRIDIHDFQNKPSKELAAVAYDENCSVDEFKQ